MFPLVGIPKTVANFLQSYRDVFCREEGFEHIKRYISGLLLSPNKTLQGILLDDNYFRARRQLKQTLKPSPEETFGSTYNCRQLKK